jgi:hypothetical protein
MKLESSLLRCSLFVLTLLIALPAFRAAAQTKPDSAPAAQAAAIPARITQAIDETQLVRLKGNVHPLARPEFDQGIVSDAMLANRMLLLLQRSAEQEATLRQVLDDQQNKASANFHNWLTPEQYGKQFGPADTDIQAVTDWLSRQGFHAIQVNVGRTMIEFSGNVSQVRKAFHTEIHRYLINGENRQANSSDPQIPAALTPVVAGIAGLHDFPPKAHVHNLGTFRRDKATGEVKPLFTYNPGSGSVFAVGPTDFATIYNVAPLWTAGTDGTGQKIALVGDSNINLQDVTDFRNMFGLPTANPSNTPQVIVNGPDPGLNGDEIEADLDVQWSGAVAKNAQIILVVTQQPQTIGAAGVDLSAQYIIDNNLAPVMSESFGICEAGANNLLESLLWQQASAQGITAMVSAGDNGSAGCDPTQANPLVATQGLAVSGVASTPFNVAVGGTDFNSSLAGYASTYWNTSNAATTESSAKSYIPEITWNNTCAFQGLTTACTSTVITNDANNLFPGVDVAAGSGGSSAVYTGSSNKPSWQTGLGDANRDLPDVSLFAANGRNGSFYVICEQDANASQGGNPSSCDLNSPFVDFLGVGGTSASSPAFAGIMALVNQKTGQRQGNANYVLYPMSKKSGATCTSNAGTAASPGSCVFYDLPAGSGNISVACQGGSPQCSNTSTAGTSFGIMTTTTGGTTPAYNTAAGYDLATGLGSVNAANLVNTWTNPSFTPSTTTFALNGGSAVSSTHGSSITVSGTVKPTSGSGTPTGIVELIQGTTAAGPVIDVFALSGGSYNGHTTMLPGTTVGYKVIAHYGGDGTFAASDSTAQNVTSVAKENSSVTVSFVTSTGAITTGSQNVQYGSPYILRVDVTNSALTPCSQTVPPTIPCPSGVVTVKDNGNPLNDFLVPGTTTATNTANLTLGVVEDQPVQLPGGNHSITASYAGDNSYSAQPNSNTLSVTITPTATQVSGLGANPASGVTTATPVALTAAMISGSNSAVGLTGTVTFFSGGVQIGTPASVTPFPATSTVGAGGQATLTTTFTTAGTKTITAQYSGDTNYAASPVSGSIAVTVTQAQTGTFTVAYNPNPVVLSSSTGASAMSAVTVTPSGGFTGTVNVVCPSTASLPPGVTCTAPAPINIVGANPVAANLTLAVTATSTTLSASAAPAERPFYAAGMAPAGLGKGWLAISGVTGLATIFLLILPGRKRYRTALGLGLVCMFSFTLGCGGGYGGGGGGGGGGPVTTVTHISVPAPGRVASGSTFTFTATVIGGTPTDQVQLYDNGVAIGTAVAVSGGTATLNSPALSVGTHSISAHYFGDATYTKASLSGSLNVTVTGSTSVAITTSPVATPAAPALNVTIN